MDILLQDPEFRWIVLAIFAVFGILIGWKMRETFSEKDVVRALDRTEQEKNTLARLYTQIKHQHDLREADFKKAALELNSLRDLVTALDAEKTRRAPQEQAMLAKAQHAENQSVQFMQRIRILEEQSQQLETRNFQLGSDLRRAQQELEAWQVLYRDFQLMQQKLLAFEQSARTLETDRNQLRQQLAAARIEIENLQLELLQQANQLSYKTSAAQGDRKGGPAAPENTDDLKIINGIAPFAEQQLHALGIHTFAQLSHWDDEAIIAFAKALGISPGKIYQEDWVGQARHLSSAKQG